MKQYRDIDQYVFIHPELNNYLDVNNLSTYSHKKIWWKCAKGHEWEQVVSARAKNPNSCQICNGRKILKGLALCQKCSDFLIYNRYY